VKGVLLAGGTAKRLRPVSQIINKHLLPVYDKPMIFCALRTLIEVGIRDVLLVTGPGHVNDFERLIGSGGRFGCRIQYAIQKQPSGTGSAVLLAESFVGADDFAVALGDNLYTEDLSTFVQPFPDQRQFRGKILVARVRNPERYAVVVLRSGRISDVVEKPEHPPSSFVSTGFWMLRPDVFDSLRRIPRSPRGEYEMTDVLAGYARDGVLGFARLRRKWLDVGTFESLYKAHTLMRRADRREHAALALGAPVIAYEDGAFATEA